MKTDEKVQCIYKREDLIKLAQELGVGDQWHEPDEVEVDAVVRGRTFDNAGFWPEGHTYPATIAEASLPSERWTGKNVEKHVVIKKDGKEVAAVNLATLLAFACGTYEGH